MNFNLTKGTLDGSYTYLFAEKLYSDKVSSKDPREYFAASYAYYDLKSLEEKIELAFGKPKDTIIHYRHLFADHVTKVDEKAYIYDNMLIMLKNKSFAGYKFDDDDEETTNVEDLRDKLRLDIFADGTVENITEKFDSLLSRTLEKARKPSELSILCFNQMDGFYLKNVKTDIKKVDNYLDNYNEDFQDVANHIIEKLNEKNEKGVVLLHGLPGTGKTTFIRQLTKEIRDKQIIYIPPNFAANIANPDFISFFLDYTNSILIVEDAENILKSRKSGANDSVANLLNISDGLLGDGLKLQILCTFNADLTEIDEALLRDGRLVAEYKFEKLTLEKTKNLIEKVYTKDMNETEKLEFMSTIKEPMTIAEVYNFRETKYKTKKQSAIGFARNR
jgi:hypothetical protein